MNQIFLTGVELRGHLSPTQAEPDEQFSEKVQRLLKLQYSLYIPIITPPDRFRGVVIALSRDQNLSSERNRLESFVASADLWYELAEELRDRDWAERTLTNVMPLLPRLAMHPFASEEFLAGLAVLLTAHQGLGWNRVLIFRAEGAHIANVRYGLGGLSRSQTPKQQQEQQELMKLLEKSELSALLDARLAQPKPVRLDGTLDPLYELITTEEVAKKLAVRFQITEVNSTDDVAEAGSPSEWIRERHRYPSRIIPINSCRGKWFESLADHKGLFPNSTMYVFPLWCLHEKNPKPQGFVCVDMSHFPEIDSDQRRRSTRLFLDTVSGIIHVDERINRYLNITKYLYSDNHPKTRHLSAIWANLESTFEPILCLLPRGKDDETVRELPKQDEVKVLLRKLTARYREAILPLLCYHSGSDEIRLGEAGRADSLLLEFATAVFELDSTLHERARREANTARSFFKGHIGVQLQQWIAESYSEQIQLQVNDRINQEIELPCPIEVLREGCECLIENSIDHNPTIREIRIDITLQREISVDGSTIVSIQFRDRGRGIRPEDRKHLLLAGFRGPTTSSKPPSGQGLHLAMNQIVSYGGILSADSLPADTDDASLIPGNEPAVFTILFRVIK